MPRHIEFAKLAAEHGAELIIFPELSLSGYQPLNAYRLSVDLNESSLNPLDDLARDLNITIAAGAPIKAGGGNEIGMIVFYPNKERGRYSKKFLYPDENPYFIPGRIGLEAIFEYPKVAPAICYEISIPEHSKSAANIGSEIYAASVAKDRESVERSYKTLSNIAKTYSMITLMSNCLGEHSDFIGYGKSTAWNQEGEVIGEMDSDSEGILLVDTENTEATRVIDVIVNS